ncbi:MAG TPA: NAD(P)H-binding protein, partial [Patescibacteria group bacterium]|nr:NAD(P)H-binding protein [Patescibacteria group bacterium]
MSENGKTSVLLVAPTSYLGWRLMLKLLERPEVRLRVLVADRRNLGGFPSAAPEIIVGDIFDEGVLRRAAEGIDAAYFPVRFLGTDPEFDRQVKVFAAKFRDACAAEGVGRIIFLGVLTRKESGNDTIQAMIDVGEILSARPERIPTVWLRAGFILGSGSLLFEVLSNLVQKLPVLPTPRWMETRISVIGARDLQEYLVQAMTIPLSGNIEVEVGLPPRSLRDMLAATARVMGLSRAFLPVPFNAMRLSPAVLTLLTSFSAPLSSVFIRLVVTAGKTHGDIPQENARRHFPGIVPASFEEVVSRAVEATRQEEVISRWTDSIDPVAASDEEKGMSRSMFKDVRRESFGTVAPEKIFRAVKSIGGKEGWFNFDLLWRIRGAMDKLTGGYGVSVGRRAEGDLRVGDILDV